MLHGNEAVRVRARVRVFPRASCGVLPARVLQKKAIAYSHNAQQPATAHQSSPAALAQRHESMRLLIALLLAQASAFLCQHRRTLHTSLRSDPRDEAIEVEAYVEDLIDDVVRDVKKAKEEEINQKSVDAMIDSAIGSDDDPFKDIPKATGLLDNL